MKNLPRHKAFVYATLLLWLFAIGSGMHGHFCFDGNEPPVSVHFDVIADQVDTSHDDGGHNDVAHKDIDSKPAQLNLLKLSNPDLHFLAALLLLVIVRPLTRTQQYHLPNTPFSWLSIVGLRPPLRAPPF